MEISNLSGMEQVVQWLEEEQRQSKATAFKLQQQQEQIQNALWSLGERLNSVEVSITAVMGYSSRVARLEEDVRQARELLERINDSVQQQRQQSETEEQARTVELERERTSRTQALQKQEEMDRILHTLQEKIENVEEYGRRRSDELTRLSNELPPLRTQDEKLQSQISAAQNQLKHQEQEVEKLQLEQQSLQAQDEVLQGRVFNITDQLRRLEGEESLRELEQRLTQTLQENSELNRMERQRLERSLTELQRTSEQYHTNIDDLQKEAGQLQAKVTAYSQHLEHLREQQWEWRNEIADQLRALLGSQEVQKRRQISELEQQIKELSHWDPPAPRL